MIASAIGISVGSAVGFLFGALGILLGKWCEKYGPQTYVGDGVYTMDIYDKYWSPQATEVHGLFNITYNPPITEMINEVTPTGLSAHKFDIQVPA
jgi:hypothetical protein